MENKYLINKKKDDNNTKEKKEANNTKDKEND